MFYLITLACFVVINALLISWLRKKGTFVWKTLLTATSVFAIIAIPIDIFLTSKGVWTFGKQAFDIWLFGLPLEEYLFYVIIIPFIMLLCKVVETIRKEC